MSLKRITLLKITGRQNLFYLTLFCMVFFGRYLLTLPISDIYFLNVNKIRKRQQINWKLRLHKQPLDYGKKPGKCCFVICGIFSFPTLIRLFVNKSIEKLPFLRWIIKLLLKFKYATNFLGCGNPCQLNDGPLNI